MMLRIVGIKAQMSLYPLGQAILPPAIGKALHIFQEHGLEERPGAMSASISGEISVVFQALIHYFGVRNARCIEYGCKFGK